MNLKGLSKKIVLFLKSSLMLYLFAFLLFQMIVDRDLLKLKALNQFLPSSVKWEKFTKNPEKLNDSELMEFVDYYEKVIQYMPHRADAYGMLAFSYYYLEEYNKAISFYKKAIKKEPHFFWPHFNLGIIYFNSGHYPEAAEAFQGAIATSSARSLAFIELSKMYQDAVKYKADSDDAVRKRLDDGYRDCFALLLSSYYHLKNFSAMLQSAVYVINSSSGSKEEAYYYAGLAAYELKEYERGVLFFQESLRRDPRHTHALHYLGLCLKALGKERMSAGILKQAESLPKRENPIRSREENIEIRLF